MKSIGIIRVPLATLVATLFLACAASLSAITITTSSLPQATVDVPYGVQIATSGGAGIPMWSAGEGLPPGITLSDTGVLSGTPTEVGSFQFTVNVSDQSPAPASKNLAIYVGPCVPVITPDGTSPLPSGDIGLTYPSITIKADGCPGPFTFSASVSPFNPNSLPPGIHLTATGILSGKPTTTGTYNFIVDVSGPNNYQNEIGYTVTFNPLPTVTTPSPLPSGPVGIPYAQQITATGGTPPYIFSMNGNPPGITISPDGVLGGIPTKTGVYSFNIGVTDSLRGQTTAPFQITFGTAVSEIQVSPLNLTFNADLQGNPPLPQAITVVPVSGIQPPVNFRVQVDSPSGESNAAPSWLTVSPTSSNAPAGLVVSVDQGTLGEATYSARIRVLDSDGLPNDVAVTLNVASAQQQLNVLPSVLHFAARKATPGTLVQELLVSSSGAGPLGFTTSVSGNSSWITGVSPSSGQTTRNAPVVLQVQVNTNGLKVGGSYTDTIHFASTAGNVDIPVSLFIAANGAIIGVDTSGVLFQARQGGGSSSTRQVEVLNLGDPNSTVNWSASLVSGSDSVKLISSSGTASTSTPGILTLALTQTATQATPGPYYALIKIVDSNSLNSPQYVTAVLNLQSNATPPSPDLAPAGLFFTTAAGGSAPPGQSVLVNTSSASSTTFDVGVTTPDNSTWLKVSAPTGNASGQTPGSIVVSVDPTGLTAGIYTGEVNVSIGSALQSVNVTFVVQPTGASNSVSALRPAAAGCTASKLAITEIGLANNFAVPAGWPATLIVQLNDNCGAIAANGEVAASFSNGDAPLSLVGDSLGNYSATWQPGTVNTDMVVTLNATSGALQPATARLFGGISPNQTPPPTLVPNGALNNLNPVVGAPLSPGTIVQVYGTGLAAAPVSPGVLPLPKSFDQTFALVGPAQAPLYFLSDSQINIQIPNETTATQQVPIILSVNNALTLPLLLDIIPITPGVASFSDGHIIAQHADFSLVSSSSPAKPGEYLVMYLVGLGATNPSVASGDPSPSPPTLASVTVQPVVTVDSQPANVIFAGLTPGFVGLYQINFQVPSAASSGDRDVTVTQNGVTANATKLIVSQ